MLVFFPKLSFDLRVKMFDAKSRCHFLFLKLLVFTLFVRLS